jgi:hypothetical protein
MLYSVNGLRISNPICSTSKYKTKSEIPGKMEYNDEASSLQPLYLLKRAVLNALTVNIAPLSRMAFGPQETLLPERPTIPTSVLVYFVEVVLEMLLFSWEEFNTTPESFQSIQKKNILNILNGSSENNSRNSGNMLSPSSPPTTRSSSGTVASSRRASWISDTGKPGAVRDRGGDIYIISHIPLSNLCYWFLHSLKHNSLYSNKMYSLMYFCLLKRRRYWNYGVDLLIYGDESAGVNGLVDELCMAYPFIGYECAVYCRLLCNVLRYSYLT